MLKTTKLAAVAGALLLLSVSLPFSASEEEILEAGMPVDCVAAESGELMSVDSAISKPGRSGGCLPSQALTCAQMPIPVGGTCSCSAVLLPRRCKACDVKFKGHVLQTTCTVSVPCNNPGCDIQPNFSRTGFSCVPS